MMITCCQCRFVGQCKIEQYLANVTVGDKEGLNARAFQIIPCCERARYVYCVRSFCRWSVYGHLFIPDINIKVFFYFLKYCPQTIACDIMVSKRRQTNPADTTFLSICFMIVYFTVWLLFSFVCRNLTNAKLTFYYFNAN